LACCCMSGCAVTAAVTFSPAIKSRKKNLLWDFKERNSRIYKILANKEVDMKTISTETTKENEKTLDQTSRAIGTQLMLQVLGKRSGGGGLWASSESTTKLFLSGR
jgi:hypothetical protein